MRTHNSNYNWLFITTGINLQRVNFWNAKALASSVYKVKETSILCKIIILIFEWMGVYYNRMITWYFHIRQDGKRLSKRERKIRDPYPGQPDPISSSVVLRAFLDVFLSCRNKLRLNRTTCNAQREAGALSKGKTGEEEIYLQHGITVSPRVIFRASCNE